MTTIGTCLRLTPDERPDSSWPSLRPVQAPSDDDIRRDTAAPARRVHSPIGLGYYIVPGTGGHGRARADGLLAVIQAFPSRVRLYGYDRTRRDKFLIMVAVRPVLDALEVLLPQVALQMEAAASAAARAYGKEVPPTLPAARRRALKVPYFRSYLRGYGEGVAETVRSLRAELLQSAGSELGQILFEEDALAETMYNRGFPGTHLLRPERASHPDGYQEGLSTGLTADLGDKYAAQHDLVFAML
jgi:hypothetical protein